MMRQNGEKPDDAIQRLLNDALDGNLQSPNLPDRGGVFNPDYKGIRDSILETARTEEAQWRKGLSGSKGNVRYWISGSLAAAILLVFSLALLRYLYQQESSPAVIAESGLAHFFSEGKKKEISSGEEVPFRTKLSVSYGQNFVFRLSSDSGHRYMLNGPALAEFERVEGSSVSLVVFTGTATARGHSDSVSALSWRSLGYVMRPTGTSATLKVFPDHFRLNVEEGTYSITGPDGKGESVQAGQVLIVRVRNGRIAQRIETGSIDQKKVDRLTQNNDSRSLQLIILKNGERYSGYVSFDDGKRLRLRLKNGKIKEFDRSLIDRVQLQQSPQ